MKRTTIFTDEDVLRKLREIARRQNVTLSDAIRARSNVMSRAASPSVLACHSLVWAQRRKDVAEHAEELLGKEFGR